VALALLAWQSTGINLGENRHEVGIDCLFWTQIVFL